jgi:zinc protease
LPAAADLDAVIKAAASKTLTPYVDTAAGQTLMDAPPPRGAIVKTTTRAAAEITEWTLSNGAKVVLKPTTLRQDQILFRAVAAGGTSLASDAELIPARVADTVVPAGGVGRFSALMLDRILSGKSVAVVPFIDEIDEGMRGGSTPQDLETMFQLLHLRFTEPRKDPTAFAAVASQARAALANRMASPDVVFGQTIDALLSRNSPRRQPETPATVERWNLDASFAFYKARFSDASNFTFVFVGSFTLEMIRPLVETYIASLPATHQRETWRDLAIEPPDGVVQKTIEKGIAPKSEVAIVFSGPFQYDDDHRLALEALGSVLEGRLFDTIRQELGGTYSITVDPAMWKLPQARYTLRIDWTCEPGREEALTHRVFDEIGFVKATPLSTGQMARVRESLSRDLEEKNQDNGYLLNEISRRYENGEMVDLAGPRGLQTRVGSLTGESIQQAAQTYLNTERYVKVVLMPEAK